MYSFAGLDIAFTWAHLKRAGWVLTHPKPALVNRATRRPRMTKRDHTTNLSRQLQAARAAEIARGTDPCRISVHVVLDDEDMPQGFLYVDLRSNARRVSS